MYTVHATKWDGGWELRIESVGVTQTRTLEKAAEHVRDYLASLHGIDTGIDSIEIVPDIGDLATDVRQARAAVHEAAAAQQEAARHSRAVARQLRGRGYSVTDAAAILGISRGRISQLVKQ